VIQDSVAFKAGLVPGDVIRQICNAPTRRMTHEQAKMEIIRAGNELDFFVHRSALSKLPVNPSESRGNYSATSNNMKLVHRPLMGGLLHLVERGGE